MDFCTSKTTFYVGIEQCVLETISIAERRVKTPTMALPLFPISDRPSLPPRVTIAFLKHVASPGFDIHNFGGKGIFGDKEHIFW